MPEPKILNTPLDDTISEFALGLIAQGTDDWYPSGTAIIIAPHLALTAKHVVDDYWRHFGEDRKLKFGDLHGEFGFLAQQILLGGIGSLWAVRKLWLSSHSDLAILFLEPYSEVARTYKWRCPILQLRPPAVGEKAECFGYRGGKAIEKVNNKQITVEWTCDPNTAVGKIIEVFHGQRDRGMLNFPCFSTNAPFTHGMSGGPIFVNGLLSGIICAGGLQGKEGHELTYGASLWPLLAMTLQLDVAEYPMRSEFTVLELVQREFIRSVDLDSIRITSLDDNRPVIHGPCTN